MIVFASKRFLRRRAHSGGEPGRWCRNRQQTGRPIRHALVVIFGAGGSLLTGNVYRIEFPAGCSPMDWPLTLGEMIEALR